MAHLLEEAVAEEVDVDRIRPHLPSLRRNPTVVEGREVVEA